MKFYRLKNRKTRQSNRTNHNWTIFLSFAIAVCSMLIYIYFGYLFHVVEIATRRESSNESLCVIVPILSFLTCTHILTHTWPSNHERVVNKWIFHSKNTPRDNCDNRNYNLFSFSIRFSYFVCCLQFRWYTHGSAQQAESTHTHFVWFSSRCICFVIALLVFWNFSEINNSLCAGWRQHRSLLLFFALQFPNYSRKT